MSVLQYQRIRSLDVIRGVAVLGIFIMNAADMAYPQDLVMDFQAADPGRGWNFWLAFTAEVMISGKMRGVFTLLFGVSAVLIIDKLVHESDRLTAARFYFRRLIWLLLFGLVNAYVFLWWGDVLFKYALLGTLLFFLRPAPSSLLVLAMLACLAVLTIQPYNTYRDISELQQDYATAQDKQRTAQPLTPQEQSAIEEWLGLAALAEPDKAWIEQEIQVKTGAYADTFKFIGTWVQEEHTFIFYQEDAWDMLLFMLLGMILLRMRFFDDQVSQFIHISIALCGIGMGLGIHLWLNAAIYAHYADPIVRHYYPIFFDLGRLPFVIGYVSLIIFASRLAVFRVIGDGMEAVGRMALSNYLMQSIIGAIVFYGFGLALFSQLSRMDLAAMIFLVWVFQVSLSVLWMRLFYHGPFEWLWRSLTYWKAQPLRRTGAG